MNCGQMMSKQHSKSALNSKAVKSTLLPPKNSYSSIKDDFKKVSTGTGKRPDRLECQSQSDKDILLGSASKADDHGLSRLTIREHNQENDHLSGNGSLIVETLLEIRDLTKENLLQHKKLIKLLEDKQQISFLYGEEHSQMKYFRPKKECRKSVKRNPEKSSTTKQLGKS